MQTFLPYPLFSQSAACLDYRRLGKQRVETKQIARALTGESTGWRNHPATKMWAGHVQALLRYGIAVCAEWRSRGYKDTLLDWFAERFDGSANAPDWIGDADFHAAHRSNLLRKDPVYYARFGWSEPPDLPYVWPVGGAL